MLEDLLAAKKVVGVRESTRAVQEGIAQRAFVALDAEDNIVFPFWELCREYDVPLERVGTMKKIGEMCDIDVGCAVVVIVEN